MLYLALDFFPVMNVSLLSLSMKLILQIINFKILSCLLEPHFDLCITGLVDIYEDDPGVYKGMTHRSQKDVHLLHDQLKIN